MPVYRRRLLLAQARPYLLLALMGVVVSLAAANPGELRDSQANTLASGLLGGAAHLECVGPNTGCGASPEVATARPELAAVPPPPPPIALAAALIDGLGEAALTNIAIATSLLDGAVMEPGGYLSFDDTARTWDYSEDERYVMGTATSIYGLVPMRGGGVCWLSTALWRAALAAGLRTELRESHVGLVEQLGPGLDATNTLVIRNDSPIPITVRAWIDDENVHAALFADRPLDRSTQIRGPIALGRGRYVVYQHTVWEDGTERTSEFVSRYYW